MRTLLTSTCVIMLLAFSTQLPATSSTYQNAKQEADTAYDQENYRNALRKYKDLATYGDSYSQYRLALMNVRGLGTDRDLVEAYAWASLAAEKDHPALEQFRDAIWAEMNSNQQQRAERQADKYTGRYGRLALARKAQRSAKRQLRNCTGSRLGSSCGRVYSAAAPRGGAITAGPGPFAGVAGGRSNPRLVTSLINNPQQLESFVGDSGNPGGISNNNQGANLGPAVRDPDYYDRLRDSIDTLEQLIAQYESGKVELKELEIHEDEAVDRNAN